MREGLDEPVLLRLTHEAMIAMYGCGPGYVARSIPGAAMVLSGEQVADLNYLVTVRSNEEDIVIDVILGGNPRLKSAMASIYNALYMT